jgi:hypothetical protein
VPLFYFILKVGYRTIPDVEGQELADETAARHHAVAVAGELMRNREPETRFWRIQVCDDYLHPRFELLFAEVDQNLGRFQPDLHLRIERVNHMAMAFNNALSRTRATLTEVWDTIARAAARVLASPSHAPRSRPE